MELELGLALPSILNSYGYEPKSRVMGSGSDPCSYEGYGHLKKKRCFDEAFDTTTSQRNDDQVPETLTLLVWNKEIVEEDDSSFILNKSIDEDENGAIGWPPIKSWRKNLWREKQDDNWMVENGGGRGSNSKYVKVKMEGVGIARKVDLSLHHSYHTLTHTLVGMFGKCQESVKAYKLTYQDKEGDWLLAGDVPWGTFTRSVQRLKLLKNIR